MASVLFSSFGQIVGGPLGGVLGTLAGVGTDEGLRRRSRALPDLRVQTSAYGDLVPRVYGRTRVAGVMIWASPLTRGGGGKGGQGGTDGYVASLAVALSSRPVISVGRIWADGREIRNSDGVFTHPVTFRLHRGLPGQSPDPLIMAFEGAGSTPAYQDLAYIVLEDFPLGSSGNRIPVLSFEVLADESPVAEEWLGDLLAPLPFVHTTLAPPQIAEGFAASGESLRDNAEGLARYLGIDLQRVGVGWRVSGEVLPWTVPAEDVVDREGRGTDPAPAVQETDYEGLPARSEVGYQDPSRDFQSGIQSVDSGRAGRTRSFGLAVTATAEQARRLAQHHLQREQHAADRLILHLAWKWMQIAPGHLVRFEGRPGLWKVEEKSIRAGGIELACVRSPASAAPLMIGTDPGRALLQPAQAVPATDLMLFETVVPLWPGRTDEIVVIASGPTGWRGADLWWRPAGAVDEVPLGRVSPGPCAGSSLLALGAGFPGVWDWRTELRVQSFGDAERLQGRPPLAVLQGANLLLLGSELIQFLEAEAGEDGQFILRGLLRGCLGTEAAAHAAGERWASFAPGEAARIPVQASWTGGAVTIEARGPGDWPAPSEAELHIEGLGQAPLSPCHVQVIRDETGDVTVGWIARRRDAFDWGADTGGESGLHVVEIRSPSDPSLIFRSAPTGSQIMNIGRSALDTVFGSDPQLLQVVVEAVGAGPARSRRSRPVGVWI